MQHTSIVRLFALCFLCGVVRYRQLDVVVVVALALGDVRLLFFFGEGTKGRSIGLTVRASATCY